MPWLWLLKLWNPFKGFLKANWKWIAIVLAVVAAYLIINHHINHLKQVAYQNGEVANEQKWQDRIKAEDAANRKYEQLWQSAIDEFGKKFENAQNERIKETNTHTETIKTVLDQDPNSKNCKVSQKVLDERNAIRKLGPTQ